MHHHQASPCVVASNATVTAPRREKDPKKRVVITGMGLVSVFGNDVDKYYYKLLAGENGITFIDKFNASNLPVRFGGQIRGFSSDGYIDEKNEQTLDDCQRYCVVAGKKALEDAALGILELSKINKERAGRDGGEADLMIAGGVEAPILSFGVAGLAATTATSTRNNDPQTASRPWDKDRDGFVIGEGAGVLVMESLEHAMERDAPIIAEYLGGAVNCDAYHITSPRPDGFGVSSCIQRSLINAGVSAEEVLGINVGSGYQQKDRKPSQNDKTEHGMEKTVQNQGQSPKMPKSESILKNTIECNLNPSDGPGKPNSIFMKTVKTKWALNQLQQPICVQLTKTVKTLKAQS
ncbi:3-oxoacyl-[acyl-carrier-protein] synthase 2 [Tanacetum coccineum]